MFLFKNTKSQVKRIGMNMVVYGFVGVFVLMMLAVFLPEVVVNYIHTLTVIFSVVAILGSIISIVCFFIELFAPTKATTAGKYEYSGHTSGCRACGKPLRAFHYYRDNRCWTYCEKCGKPYQACYAAPYRTIELMFSGIQREGTSLTVEIKNWPSLECASLRWYEWSFGGGHIDNIDLPSNYMLKHTVDEFINEYILKDNKVMQHIPNSNSKEFLDRIRNALTESGVFQNKTGAALIKEVVLLEKPLSDCRAGIEPTNFVINLFADKVEIVWGVGWGDGTSHADGAGGTEILEADYFEENTIDDFVDYLNSKQWGKDFVQWFNIKGNKQITSLFRAINKPIKLMTDFLQNKNYDIAFNDNAMTIAKHSGEPWNNYRAFVAKPDGVYNYIERTMGSYELTKRLACSDLEISTFVVLAYFVSESFSKEKTNDTDKDTIIAELKKHLDTIMENTSDCYVGQWLIDEIISFVK